MIDYADLVARLVQAGATPAIIKIAVEGIAEIEQAESTLALRARKRKNQQDHRARHRAVTAMSPPVTGDVKKTPTKTTNLSPPVTGDVTGATNILSFSSSSLLPLVAPSSGRGRRERAPVAGQDDDFERFYKKWPLKKARRAAKRAWDAAIKRAPIETILAGEDQYVATQNPQFYCHPATWLNGDRWADEAHGNGTARREPHWTEYIT